jgi:hypothetical protein
VPEGTKALRRRFVVDARQFSSSIYRISSTATSFLAASHMPEIGDPPESNPYDSVNDEDEKENTMTKLFAAVGIGTLALLLGLPAVMSAQDDKPQDAPKAEPKGDEARPPKQDEVKPPKAGEEKTCATGRQPEARRCPAARSSGAAGSA